MEERVCFYFYHAGSSEVWDKSSNYFLMTGLLSFVFVYIKSKSEQLGLLHKYCTRLQATWKKKIWG